MKTRTMHELLKLMREEVETNGVDLGLCFISLKLARDKITINESCRIRDYIQKHKPANAQCGYWWKEGDVAPRVCWLNDHIKATLFNHLTSRLWQRIKRIF